LASQISREQSRKILTEGRLNARAIVAVQRVDMRQAATPSATVGESHANVGGTLDLRRRWRGRPVRWAAVRK